MKGPTLSAFNDSLFLNFTTVFLFVQIGGQLVKLEERWEAVVWSRPAANLGASPALFCPTRLTLFSLRHSFPALLYARTQTSPPPTTPPTAPSLPVISTAS